MGLIDKIKDVVNQTGVTEELCAHLNGIGVQSCVVDKNGPEALHHTATLGVFGLNPTGVVKVSGRNIEVVEMYRVIEGGVSRPLYKYQYVTRIDVGEREDQFNCKIDYVMDGAINRELVNFGWKGGRLAQALNVDGELKSMLTKSGIPPLVVRANKKDGCVALSLGQLMGGWTRKDGSPVGCPFPISYGKYDFPSQQSFEMYDRIMGHVKTMAGAVDPA
jgi:hypothetical protein